MRSRSSPEVVRADCTRVAFLSRATTTGNAIAFTPSAANLMAGDSNGNDDAMIFFEQA